jgi:hypothetical protein
MALKTATRGAQRLLMGEFVASFNDTMKDINGVLKTFGSVFGDAGTFDAILLPVGAVIQGGELLIDTQGAGPTAYTVQIGTASTASAFLGPTTLTGVAGTKTVFTGGGYADANAGQNVRIVIASTVANATAGKFRVRVYYTIDGKVDETVTN